MSASIPDRAGALTEQRNPRTMRLHCASVSECVALLNAEDRTVADAVAKAAPELVGLLEAVEPRFRAGGRLIYLGAGTSGRLGVLDASECPPTFQTDPDRVVGVIAGGDGALRRSSEAKEDDPEGAKPDLEALALAPNDTVIGIAAGGTTAYVLGGLRRAKDAGALTCLVTCSPLGKGSSHRGIKASRQTAPIASDTGCLDASMTRCHDSSTPGWLDHLVFLPTGPEAITGSTRMKAGTATKMALNIISTTLMVRTGKVHQNLMVDLRATNAKLLDRAARIVMELTGLSRADAFELLDRAGGGVKAAVVMQRRGVDWPAAEALLRDADGRLDIALGEA